MVSNGFTGEIHLLAKDLKSNVSKYIGDILKCKYAKDGGESRGWHSIF